MRIPVNTVFYYDTEVDIEAAREFITRYALTKDDVKMVRLNSGGLSIVAKRDINLDPGRD